MRAAAAALGLVAIAAAVIAAASPEAQLPVMRVILLVVGIAAAVGVLRRIAPTTASSPEVLDAGLRNPPTAPSEIESLRSIEVFVAMAAVHPYGVEWLRPMLRELASWRLMRTRGITIEREPAASRTALGEQLWGLVGPDAGRGTFSTTRMPVADLAAAVTSLERLG